MSGVYDLTLAAGASQTIGALGSVFRLLTAPQGAIVVKFNAGESFTFKPGQGLRLRPDSKGNERVFRDVTIRNPQAVAQTISVFIGPDGFEDSTITGDVSVIDRAASKTRLGSEFLEYASTAANAGAVSNVTLYGNGQRLAVHSLVLGSATAGLVHLGYFQGLGTSTLVNGSLNNKNPYLSAALASKKGEGATTVGAAPTGGEVPGYVRWGAVYVGANTPLQLALRTPIVLESNSGLIVLGVVINRDVQCGFEVELVA